ncbi:unnamed protein product [Orchesella dallaii]|uniref:Protein regulator of cytokinesis 1 n=1 Tax=Orchesella dallaii TaxID=48710 RepID=A0ABP1R4F7_9HEXA
MAAKSNEEYYRIQEWIAEWRGTSVENCEYTWEDIREICRGSMREVLLDFVLPRFRTDQQIEVIRSNLSLNVTGDTPHQDPREGSNIDEEIRDLQKKIQNIKEEKAAVLNRITGHQAKLINSKMQGQQLLMEKAIQSENLSSHSDYIRTRIVSTDELLETLQQYKCHKPEAITSSSSPNNDLPQPDSISPQLTLLKSLYDDTIDLFNIYFLQETTLIGERLALEDIVSSKITELRQSGVSPDLIARWTKREQETFSKKLQTASTKLSDIMSPLTELRNETDNIYVKLMQALVELHFRNRTAQRADEDLEAKNAEKIEKMIHSDSCILPADFFTMIQKEQELARLKRCKELNLQLEESSSRNQGMDEELLKLFGNGSTESKAVSSGTTSKLPNDKSENTSGESPSFVEASVRVETLQAISCALLRSFPQSVKRLGAITKNCRNLVFDEFPKAVETKCRANCRNEPAKVEPGKRESIVGRQVDDVQVQILEQFVFNADLVSSVGRKRIDMNLQGLFNLTKELERKRKQSKVVVNEFINSKKENSSQ